MNTAATNDPATTALATAARAAYCDDRRAEAARLYGEAAERSREARQTAEQLEHLRWHGNSLMWEARHEEALRVLLEVATHEHPQAEPDAIFGAKTDCIMVALFHSPASAIRELIAEAHRYLARISKEHWRHRLGLLASMLLSRQGHFAEAAELGMQSYRLHLATKDGPHFTNFAHLKWIVRACFRGGAGGELAHWLEIANHHTFEMVSDRLRLQCIRLAHARLLRSEGESRPGLLEDARQALGKVARSDYVWEEFYDVARALMIAGELDQVMRLQPRQSALLPFEDAALTADAQINLLRRELGLPPWDSELNYPREIPSTLTAPATVTAATLRQVSDALRRLHETARKEDARLATNCYHQAAKLRCEHARFLIQRAGLPQSNVFLFPS